LKSNSVLFGLFLRPPSSVFPTSPSQVCGHNFEAGEIGPSTIVGSAAFNMFVIIGICVWTIPAGETRKIKHLRVFFITAFWSIFAYIWLFLILYVISPGVVEVRPTRKNNGAGSQALTESWRTFYVVEIIVAFTL